MEIFDNEKSLDLSNISVARIATLSLVEDNFDTLINNLSIAKDIKDKRIKSALAKISEYQHPDLMYASAILASTVVNLNDDGFLPEEMWAARNTPINTPFNNDHESEDIIGHVIAARTLDSDGKEISEQEKYFDIHVDLVVYKSIFPAIAKDISDNAPEGKKFVSMEATFDNFDYGLIDDSGNMKVVARNQETSFLTKYLRAYGGEGIYQDYKMARILRDFRFSGIGSVDVPANPSSEYNKIENYSFASIDKLNIKNTEKEKNKIIISKSFVYINKGEFMTIENLEQANQVIADLEGKLAKFETKEGETLKARITSLETEKTTLAEKITVEESKVTLADQKIADLTKELDTTKATLKTKTDELDNINKQSRVSARLSQLTEAGIAVTDENKQKFVDMAEEAFATIVDYAKSFHKDTKTQSAEEIAAAEKAAKQTVAGAQKQNKEQVTNTVGDDRSEDIKGFEKTVAKLSEALTADRKSRNPAKNK